MERKVCSMGLDQYLLIKSKKLEEQGGKVGEITGACSGLFPFAPKTEDGEIEAGYWRKAYSVNDLILEDVLGVESEDDVNLKRLKLTKDQVIAIHEAAVRKLELMGPNRDDEDWEAQDWENTEKVFSKTRKLMEEDPDAEVFYMIWF